MECDNLSYQDIKNHYGLTKTNLQLNLTIRVIYTFIIVSHVKRVSA